MSSLERKRQAAIDWLQKGEGKKPPKKWIEEKVKEIMSGGGKKPDDPYAVAAHIWYHKMTPAQRNARKVKYEGKRKKR